MGRKRDGVNRVGGPSAVIKKASRADSSNARAFVLIHPRGCFNSSVFFCRANLAPSLAPLPLFPFLLHARWSIDRGPRFFFRETSRRNKSCRRRKVSARDSARAFTCFIDFGFSRCIGATGKFYLRAAYLYSLLPGGSTFYRLIRCNPNRTGAHFY